MISALKKLVISFSFLMKYLVEINLSSENLKQNFEKERRDMKILFNEELLNQTEKLIRMLKVLKEENEALNDDQKRLENRIKDLEDLNKKQLLQFIDTSNIPEPLRLSKKSLVLKSMEDVAEINKINDRNSSLKPTIQDVNLFNQPMIESKVANTSSAPSTDLNDRKKEGSRDNREAENIMTLLELNESDCIEGAGILKRSEALVSILIL